jgi:hypothetical protein
VSLLVLGVEAAPPVVPVPVPALVPPAVEPPEVAPPVDEGVLLVLELVEAPGAAVLLSAAFFSQPATSTVSAAAASMILDTWEKDRIFYTSQKVIRNDIVDCLLHQKFLQSARCNRIVHGPTGAAE